MEQVAGVVVAVRASEQADALERSIRADDGFSLTEFAFIGPRASDGQLLERLGALCRSGAPFVLACAVGSFTQAQRDGIEQTAAGAGVVVRIAGSIADVLRPELRRPPMIPPSSIVDVDLLTVAFGPEDAVGEAWGRWRARCEIDHAPGMLWTGPILHERFGALGIIDDESGRLAGLRRRAWYRTSVLGSAVADAARRLADAGIEAEVVGDLPDAWMARSVGKVRHVGTASILVTPENAVRAHASLVGDSVGVGVGSHQVLTTGAIERRSSVWLELDEGRRIQLRWRWLPARSDRLVTRPEDSAMPSIDVDGVHLGVPTESARLLEAWLRCVDRRRDPTGPFVCVIDLQRRHSGSLDWAWIEWACGRLELPPPTH